MTLPHLLSKALQAGYGEASLRAVFPLRDRADYCAVAPSPLGALHTN
jgi:hypothetical protein